MGMAISLTLMITSIWAILWPIKDKVRAR